MRGFAYRNYLVTVLLIVLALNGIERLALGVLLQDIKIDLGLSDTQLGLLTGIAFALFYSIMGIPIARWADRGDRVLIISLTTVLWTTAVAISGFAGSFVQFLLIRIGVAVGEAGCVPAAQSLIAEAFDRAERPRAVARYMLGIPLSAVIGYLVVGWINQLFGWRATFALLGLPGLGLAAITWFTLREPRRSQIQSPRSKSELAAINVTARDVFLVLWRNMTFRHLLFCFAVSAFFSSGIGKWQPAFFIRSYGLHTGEVGTWFAAVQGSAGLLGTVLGGELATRYAASNERLQLKAIANVYCCLAIVWSFIYISPNYYLAFACMGIAAFGGSAALGPLFAIIQTVVPEQM